ncbi:hypothetical protein KEM55_003077 [Ascosphaera atra]|nr:hypothetical protein KEM55_003077 [Ascosphaera atra]
MSSQSSSSPSSRPSNDTASEAWGSPEKPVVIDEPEGKPSARGSCDSDSYNPSSGSDRPIDAACDHSESPVKKVALQPADDASLGTPEKPIVFDDSEQDDYVISAPPSAPKSLTETSTPNTSPLKRAYGPFSVEEDCFESSDPDPEEEHLELKAEAACLLNDGDDQDNIHRDGDDSADSTQIKLTPTITSASLVKEYASSSKVNYQKSSIAVGDTASRGGNGKGTKEGTAIIITTNRHFISTAVLAGTYDTTYDSSDAE